MDIRISKTIFSKKTILKVVYAWQENFLICISEDESNYILTVSAKNNAEFDFETFNSALQEQQLRETLNEQFGSLRNSIYNKAFELFER